MYLTITEEEVREGIKILAKVGTAPAIEMMASLDYYEKANPKETETRLVWYANLLNSADKNAVDRAMELLSEEKDQRTRNTMRTMFKRAKIPDALRRSALIKLFEEENERWTMNFGNRVKNNLQRWVIDQYLNLPQTGGSLKKSFLFNSLRAEDDKVRIYAIDKIRENPTRESLRVLLNLESGIFDETAKIALLTAVAGMPFAGGPERVGKKISRLYGDKQSMKYIKILAGQSKAPSSSVRKGFKYE